MLRLRYRENCFVGILLDHTRLWELFTACQDRVSCSRSSRERVLRSTSLKWSWDEEKGRACQQHKAPSVSFSPVRASMSIRQAATSMVRMSSPSSIVCAACSHEDVWKLICCGGESVSTQRKADTRRMRFRPADPLVHARHRRRDLKHPVEQWECGWVHAIHN